MPGPWSIPPIVRLLDKMGIVRDAYTQPPVGPAPPEFSVPVTLAFGVLPQQFYKAIPALNKTTSDLFNQSIVEVLPENPYRRYLKIVNNGVNQVELWATTPLIGDVAQTNDVLHGEVLYPGYGIVESDTLRRGPIFATAVDGATGLMVMEG